MPTFSSTKSLYYNDVNLLSCPGTTLMSRSEVSEEKWRIIVSPMDSLFGEEFIVAAAQQGISVFIPRFKGLDWQFNLHDLFRKSQINNKQICCVSIGLKDFDANLYKIVNRNITDLGIDIANGVLNLREYSRNIWKEIPHRVFNNFYVGNVNTKEGFSKLEKEFSDISNNLMIRVGIGGGSPCSSSDVAGINRGNITEIIECSSIAKEGKVIADGGISKPGFAAKAFAAGADYIMLGGYFSRAASAETNMRGDGSFWGGASEKQLEIIGQSDKVSEGKVLTEKQEIVPLSKLVKDLWGGLASYVTYSGYNSLTEAIGNGYFEVKQNSLPPKNRK